MASETITDLVGRQEWTRPIEEGLQQAVAGTFAAGGPIGQKVEDALHGVWLGHPLHSVLTDIPIGAWTVAVALDAADALSDHNRYAWGADAAVGIGLIGATGAALTGLTDWHKTEGTARRVGLVHGMLNLGAMALFATSWALRRRKQREAARACALIGYLVSGASAYLGGSLVYDQKIGVDHAERQALPDGFVPVLAEADLPENTLRRVEVGGVKILLARRNDRIYALGEVCAHLGGPLAEGTLEGDSVRCPWHGSCFALEDGHVLEGPSTYSQPCYAVRVVNGQIEVSGSAPAALTLSS